MIELVLAVLDACLLVYGFHPVKRWKYRHIPGPPPAWLIGNLMHIILGRNLADVVHEWAHQYGPIFKYWQGGSILVVVADPVAGRTVHLRNNSRTTLLNRFVGNENKVDNDGLLLAQSGPYWQALRQSWQMFFHPETLQGYSPLMNASAERLCNILEEAAQEGAVVDMWRLYGALTADVVGSAACGVELRTLQGSEIISSNAKEIKPQAADTDGVTIQKAAAVIFATGGAQGSFYSLLALVFPEADWLMRCLATYLPDPATRAMLQARRKMRIINYRLVDEARQELAAEEAAKQAAGTGGSKQQEAEAAAVGSKKRGPLPPGSFIKNLLQTESKLIGRKFTTAEISSQVNTFLLAGYETTASALVLTSYHLARNPAAEAKMLAEIDAFGGADAAPTVADLHKFPYTKAVLDESMRLNSPAGIGTSRVAKEDFTVCGVKIAKGTDLNVPIHARHMDAKRWPDNTLEFRPERFLTDKTNPAYLPFGEGGRSCVGMRFAIAEAMITLVRV